MLDSRPQGFCLSVLSVFFCISDMRNRTRTPSMGTSAHQEVIAILCMLNVSVGVSTFVSLRVRYTIHLNSHMRSPSPHAKSLSCLSSILLLSLPRLFSLFCSSSNFVIFFKHCFSVGYNCLATFREWIHYHEGVRVTLCSTKLRSWKLAFLHGDFCTHFFALSQIKRTPTVNVYLRKPGFEWEFQNTWSKL